MPQVSGENMNQVLYFETVNNHTYFEVAQAKSAAQDLGMIQLSATLVGNVKINNHFKFQIFYKINLLNL